MAIASELYGRRHDDLRFRSREVLYLTPQWDDVGNSLGDQTWAWDSVSAAWTQRFSQNSPNVSHAALAFDESRGKAVLFGGVWFSKLPTGTVPIHHLGTATWLWDGLGWTAAAPAVHPPARAYANMAYDVAHSRTVLFGGCYGYAVHHRAERHLDVGRGELEARNSGSQSAARNQAAMTYDPVLGKIVMFGGRTNGETLSGGIGDMWTWDGQTWAQLHPLTMPAARYGAAIAYSRADSGLVLYGGTARRLPAGDVDLEWGHLDPNQCQPQPDSCVFCQ